jgi:hypothetical protein
MMDAWSNGRFGVITVQRDLLELRALGKSGSASPGLYMEKCARRMRQKSFAIPDIERSTDMAPGNYDTTKKG